MSSWTTLEPNFWRTFLALNKKHWLVKIRKPAYIIEIVVGMVVWMILYPIYILARDKWDGVENPPIEYLPEIPTTLLSFFSITEKPTVVGLPDNENVRYLVGNLFEIMQSMQTEMAKYIDINQVTLIYTDNTDNMKENIYALESNAIGIYWVNSDEIDAWTSPKFQIYEQAFVSTPRVELFDTLFKADRKSVV